MLPEVVFADDDVDSRLAWIREHRTSLERIPLPGDGRTVERFRALAALAMGDGSLARLVEGHLDAIAIRAELGWPERDGELSGVWAARPDLLRATREPEGWRLAGPKPWCSGADGLDRALVTATSVDGVLLFDVPVREVEFDDDWDPPGMRASDSRTAHLDVVVEAPIGPPGCYVERSGFWHGGVGVAACWHGLAQRIAADVAARAAERDDPYLRATSGEAASVLAAASTLLGAAARQIDDRPSGLPAARGRAQTVRAAVEHAARHVLQRVIAVDGATALCFDRAHARAVADLTVYLGQFHHGSDAAAVPADGDEQWWTA